MYDVTRISPSCQRMSRLWQQVEIIRPSYRTRCFWMSVRLARWPSSARGFIFVVKSVKCTNCYKHKVIPSRCRGVFFFGNSLFCFIIHFHVFLIDFNFFLSWKRLHRKYDNVYKRLFVSIFPLPYIVYIYI